MYNDTSIQWIPSSVTYVNSTWIQHFLGIALNVSLIPELQRNGSLQNSSLSGCISFGKDQDAVTTDAYRDPTIPSTLQVTDLIVRIILIDANHFTHFTENTKLLEHEVGEWINFYQRDARIYCTNSLRFSQDFRRIAYKSEADFSADKPAIPYAREIQLVLAVVFCAVLAICLLVAFVLRIRSFIRKQLAHRKSHRSDRENNARVHFAYDVGETDILAKPPVPSTTFGSNVYPGGLLINPRARQTPHSINSRYPTRFSQHLAYGWERYHLNGFHNGSRNQSDKLDYNSLQTPYTHVCSPQNEMLSEEPISVVHAVGRHDNRSRKSTTHCTRFLIPAGPTQVSVATTRRGSV